jgi:adenine-specific DNA-methyltransferase
MALERYLDSSLPFNKAIVDVKNFKEIPSTARVALANMDILEFLKTVEEPFATLIVTSPPYNIGKIYEKRAEFEDYLKWQANVLGECARILKTNGSICWEVGNYVENGEVFPLDVFFYKILKDDLGLKLRNRIIWRFGHGLHASKRFSGRYETILWFTKTDDYVFNLDSIRVPQKYPGKTHYKGPNIGKPSSNPKGKNPSDVWEVLLEDWESEVWDIPNVKSNHPEKTIHPCQFPIELVERLVLALTNDEDYVFDPFVGVGSALVAAVLNNRKGVGVDKEEQYIKIARDRIEKAMAGELKRRKLGTPVYVPTGREKVSQIPEEWKQ